MDILIVGGTRLMGPHLTEALLEAGHNVTLANRGGAGPRFSGRAGHLPIERTDPESLRRALRGRSFDVIYDNLAYCADDVRHLLDAADCGRYIQISSRSVYTDTPRPIREEDFDPLSHPIAWGPRVDFSYAEGKRQAECALFQLYGRIPSAAVRFPVVIGREDHTRRLFFYVEHCAAGRPMYIDNWDRPLSYIDAGEAGRFLAFLADKAYTGPVNACAAGAVTVGDICRYVEERGGVRMVRRDDGDAAPYNEDAEYVLDTSRAEGLGYAFRPIGETLYPLLDDYLREITARH